MPSQDGLFYALVRNHGDDILFAFTSPDSADEWWRAMLDQRYNNDTGPPAEDSPRIVERAGPQRFSISGAVTWGGQLNIEVIAGITKVPVPPFLPPPPRVDHLNGNAYYIRSRIQPGHFWAVTESSDVGRVLHLSSRHRPTKFIIRRVNVLPYDPKPQEDVLIGSDEVKLTAIGPSQRRDEITLNPNHGTLHPTTAVPGPALVFKFGLLTAEGGFVADLDTDRIQFCNDNIGDRWVLVN